MERLSEREEKEEEKEKRETLQKDLKIEKEWDDFYEFILYN